MWATSLSQARSVSPRLRCLSASGSRKEWTLVRPRSQGDWNGSLQALASGRLFPAWPAALLTGGRERAAQPGHLQPGLLHSLTHPPAASH